VHFNIFTLYNDGKSFARGASSGLKIHKMHWQSLLTELTACPNPVAGFLGEAEKGWRDWRGKCWEWKGKGGRGRESVSHIFFPNLGMSSNCLVWCWMWTVQIEQITISFDGGATTMNFTEAALLIQGSACIYSKKVEYLYSLVFEVLSLLGSNKKWALYLCYLNLHWDRKVYLM